MVKLKDSRTGEYRSPGPLEEPLGLYVCGPTVAGKPHLGHLRTAYAYDVLVRWLRASGFEVKFVENFTDIDDKILAKALELGEDWRTLARAFEQDFRTMRENLGILMPDSQPRATEHIPEIIELIEKLLASGAAYRGLDGSANVYYSVEKDNKFGSFTRQNLASLMGNPSLGEGEQKHATGKQHPLDFALWKAHKDFEPTSAAWQAPWGAGRPGWHIEDTAMAVKELGPRFQLHGGGRDLRLPHHESEVAQARGAGYPYAELWVHSGLVTVGGEKMAKSRGNFVLAEESYGQNPNILRLLFTRTHYSSDVEYSPNEYGKSEASWRRVTQLINKVSHLHGTPLDLNDAYNLVDQKFRDALDSDLNTPAAYAVLFDTVKLGYKLLESRSNEEELKRLLQQVLAMIQLLGFDLAHEKENLTEQMENLLQERILARSRKDFSRSDELRAELAALGVVVRDTKNGQEYEISH